MEARFQFVHLEKSEALQEFTQQKLNKLDEKFDGIISAEVHFRQDEAQDPAGHICNISVSIPGPMLFAESNEDSFEAAAAATVKDLDSQLKKRKAKMRTY